MSDTYSNKERELLETLINSLVVALKNARSFDSITRLNQELKDKNAALGTALKNLRAEIKKVEILEGIKENLKNNGDVNETAGDGLMVLFLSEDKKLNALEAVRTAVIIQKESARISKDITSLYKPLQINIGINSGKALVGAARFDSITDSRWTYTASGSLINVAARIGTLATGGQTLLSKNTAERISGHYPLKNLGLFRFKNVKEKVEVFQL